MLFNSLEYLLFLPIVFAIYWSLNSRLKVQNLFLLIASYFFYAAWDYRFLALIIVSSLTDYLVGLALARTDIKQKRKVLLGISLFVNLGLLAIFKYFNFFIESFVVLSEAIGLNANSSTLNIILPVGISFYTFQTLSYTIDIYKRRIIPTKNALNFFTYVSFFPQLVAGPIERAKDLLPQIENKRIFTYEKGISGLRQILWGFFKKVVIADNCAIFVDNIFEHYQTLGGVTLVVGAILFAIQIYGDFSGYSDIAIGTARLFGINLRQNFATPYFSRDIAEFWRRWHISLSTWFRDYLYIPLGGSRVRKSLQVRNIFTVFLVSGFWHGANFTFLFWGLLHALFYLPQLFFNTNRKYLNTIAEKRLFPSLIEGLKMLQTFLIVSFAWIFFRSNTIGDSFGYLKRIAQPTNFQLPHSAIGYDRWNLVYLFIYIGLMIIVEWMNRGKSYGLAKMSQNVIIRYMVYLLISLLVVEYFYGKNTFIYFQF